MGSGASTPTELSSRNISNIIKSKIETKLIIESINKKCLFTNYAINTCNISSESDGDIGNIHLKKLESFKIPNDRSPLSVALNGLAGSGSCNTTPMQISTPNLLQSPYNGIIDRNNIYDLIDKLSDFKRFDNLPKVSIPVKVVKSNYNLLVTNDTDHTSHLFTIQPFDYSTVSNEIESDKLSQFHEIYLPKSNIPVVNDIDHDEDDDEAECCNIASYDYKHVCTLCKLEFDTKLMFEDHINLSKIHMVKLLERRKRKNDNATVDNFIYYI